MSFSTAYEELDRAQKPAKGVSLYSRYVNRPMGRVFAAAGATVGLTPNQITAISALASGGAALTIALARPSLVTGLLIAVLIILGFALDAADGQLARLTRAGSPAGEWLDHVVDAGKVVLLHGAVLIAMYRWFELPVGWLLVPLAYQAIGVIIQAGGTLRELLGRIVSGSGRPTNRSSRWWSPIALLMADSGVFGLIFLTWPWQRVFLAVYSIFLVANAGIGCLLLIKWKRELMAAGAAR